MTAGLKKRATKSNGGNGEGRREEVLAIAARLFNEKGYRATTLSDVSDVLGFTRAALYYYFDSKQQILSAVLQDAGQRLVDNLAEVMATDITPSAKVRRVIAMHVSLLLDSPDVLGVYLTERASLPEDERRALLEGESKYMHDIASIIAAGVESGEFRPTPPLPTALTILGTVNWLQHWYRPGGDIGPDELLRLVTDLTMHGLAAPDTAR